jgi:hypothetical protein
VTESASDKQRPIEDAGATGDDEATPQGIAVPEPVVISDYAYVSAGGESDIRVITEDKLPGAPSDERRATAAEESSNPDEPDTEGLPVIDIGEDYTIFATSGTGRIMEAYLEPVRYARYESQKSQQVL